MADPRSTPSDDPTGASAEADDSDGSPTSEETVRGDLGPGADSEQGESRDSSQPEPETAAGDGIDTHTDTDADLEALRRAVEQRYDFENFGPEEMTEMTAEEWEAAFDPDTWITGSELLDRVAADLRNRIADRDVFARVERFAADAHGPERLVAYSDEGYTVVYPDGSVEGRGTVLRDVKPTVALCSMDDYDVAEPPDGELLPSPGEVPDGSGELGNLMLQIVAAVQLLAGLGLFVAVFVADLGGATIIAVVGAVVFLLAGIFLFLVVANARLSDRFRAEEYRNRLRAVDLESDERPEFLPVEVGGRQTDEDSESST